MTSHSPFASNSRGVAYTPDGGRAPPPAPSPFRRRLQSTSRAVVVIDIQTRLALQVGFGLGSCFRHGAIIGRLSGRDGADGNVIVIGTGADYFRDFFNVAKYGPLGDLLWTGEYRAPGWTDPISTRAKYSPVSVGVDAAGNIVIGGTTSTGCRQAHTCDVYLDAWVVKLNPSGDLLWWFLSARMHSTSGRPRSRWT